MDTQDRIDAIKSGLAALDTAIGQTEAALRLAATPDDVRSLTSTLVGLRSERSRLQAQLDALEAANVIVEAPGPAAQVAVQEDAKTLRMNRDDPTQPTVKPRPKGRPR